MSTPPPHGRIAATLSNIVDAGFELLPTFGMAAIPVLDGAERPGEWPEVKRRLRAEGIRARQHRGVLLLEPGELERFSSVGLFEGASELFLCADWNEEFEPFPGRISSDLSDFDETTPLGLEEWMSHTSCLLALGDGDGVNYMTPSADIAERLRSHFRAAKR